MANIDGRDRLQELIGDDYRLQWIIGHGGMSTVWLADDTVHDREVALKILRPEFSDNREFLTRFRNEAETAELIDSDNVVRTYDYREIPDPAGHSFCFIAMEYVRGESLADLLAREKSLDEALCLDVLEQAAHGLSIIHRMDLVHRDIKPGNIMITQSGQVKITDFGIAKAAAAVPLTRTGMVVGTAQYVSPEQAQGREVTAASDIYSLGVVGYEMLAGQRPFVGDSSVSVALAHISQSPPPLSTSVSAEARELIGIALRKDPTQRFADGNELALAVSAVRLGQRPPQPASAAMT
ncbi:serine/threonine-protein kinase, partial [Corynebacterium nasicanis]